MDLRSELVSCSGPVKDNLKRPSNQGRRELMVSP